jgi:hypothetical protein
VQPAAGVQAGECALLGGDLVEGGLLSLATRAAARRAAASRKWPEPQAGSMIESLRIPGIGSSGLRASAASRTGSMVESSSSFTSASGV